MIIRKPYAFLIKYFKIIHLVLSLLIAFLIFKHFAIINFFQDYISNDYIINTTSGMGYKYIPVYLYFIIILIIAILSAVVGLLNHKNKPLKFYFLMIGYYAIIFFAYLYFSSVINSFNENLLDATKALLMKDIVVLIMFPQFYFIIVCLLRTVGFDLGKFDFVSDMKEMNISLSDNEEVEVNISFDNETALRKVRKIIREISYYFFENKIVILAILGIVIFILGYNVLTHRKTNYNQTYSINKSFFYNNLGITVRDSYITNVSYNGQKLDKYYLVTKIEIDNHSGIIRSLDMNKFKLRAGNKIYTTSSSDYKYFIDLSSEKFRSTINNKSTLKTLLVFPIEKNSIGQKYKLQLYNGSVTTKDDIYTKNIFVSLNPKVVNGVSETIKFSLGTPATFDKTGLEKTSLTISSCDFKDNYKYSYQTCNNGKCTIYDDLLASSSSSNHLLVCNVNYNQDEESWYSKTNTNVDRFINNFVKVYDPETKKVISRAINKTPDKTSDWIAFEVPKEYDELIDIQLKVSIRDYEYLMLLIG